MSKTNMGTVFAEAESVYAIDARSSCWGHLYPKLGSKQNGWIEWSESAFGDTTINEYEFEGLESSEPLYHDVMELLVSFEDLEPGFYRWEGWYKKFKNCRCQFQSTPIQQATFQK